MVFLVLVGIKLIVYAWKWPRINSENSTKILDHVDGKGIQGVRTKMSSAQAWLFENHDTYSVNAGWDWLHERRVNVMNCWDSLSSRTVACQWTLVVWWSTVRTLRTQSLLAIELPTPLRSLLFPTDSSASTSMIRILGDNDSSGSNLESQHDEGKGKDEEKQAVATIVRWKIRLLLAPVTPYITIPSHDIPWIYHCYGPLCAVLFCEHLPAANENNLSECPTMKSDAGSSLRWFGAVILPYL